VTRPQRIAIVGSRAPNSELLEKLHSYIDGLPDDCVLVTGCADGVDREVRNMGKAKGLVVIACYAPWSIGRRAGPLRNSAIVAIADRVVAFPAGDSVGTLDTLRQARAAGIPFEVVS